MQLCKKSQSQSPFWFHTTLDFQSTFTSDAGLLQNDVEGVPNDDSKEVFGGFSGTDVQRGSRRSQRGREEIDPESESALLDARLQIVEKATSLQMLRHQRDRVEEMQSQTLFDGAEVG